MKFHLRIYDNFHYMDEEEAYNRGDYETYEDARNAAKQIVEGYFYEDSDENKTLENLLSSYYMYGLDPVILPSEPGDSPKFSAWDYAKEYYKSLIDKK